MSRFYDALKQASRSLQPAADETGMPDFAAIIPDAEPDDMRQTPADSSLDAVETAALPAKETDRRAAEPLPAAHPASQNGALGVATDLVLSDRARVIPNATEPMLVEYYRQLRTRIMQQQEIKPFRSLLIASADPREGKTLTALNLAWTFSLLPSYRVLVIDADLRRGHLSRWLGIGDRLGLSDLLDGSAELKQAVLKSSAVPFRFMGMGISKRAPAELIQASRWPNKLREIAGHFDLVLVDTPPVNLFADTQLLGAGCDAVLIVARAYKTSRQTLEKVRRELQRCRVIGMVLNEGESSGSRHYRHYYSKKS